MHIYLLHFRTVVGIKRGARLISVILQVACALASSLAPVTYSCKLRGTPCVAAFPQLELFRIDKSTRRFHRVATSSRVNTLALACGFVPCGATVEVIRDNEPLYSAESATPFWCTYVPRNLHLAYLPMLYPSRRFSGLQGR